MFDRHVWSRLVQVLAQVLGNKSSKVFQTNWVLGLGFFFNLLFCLSNVNTTTQKNWSQQLSSPRIGWPWPRPAGLHDELPLPSHKEERARVQQVVGDPYTYNFYIINIYNIYINEHMCVLYWGQNMVWFVVIHPRSNSFPPIWRNCSLDSMVLDTQDDGFVIHVFNGDVFAHVWGFLQSDTWAHFFSI